MERLVFAPAHLQDICGLTRAYASCAHARETLCYQHMAALWEVNNAIDLLSSYPPNCSQANHVQAIIQSCLLMVEHPELAEPVTSRFLAIRAAGVYLTALTLSSQPPGLNVRARLSSSTYNLLCTITQPESLSAVVHVILIGAERIAHGAPRHGPALAPLNPHGLRSVHYLFQNN